MTPEEIIKVRSLVREFEDAIRADLAAQIKASLLHDLNTNYYLLPKDAGFPAYCRRMAKLFSAPTVLIVVLLLTGYWISSSKLQDVANTAADKKLEDLGITTLQTNAADAAAAAKISASAAETELTKIKKAAASANDGELVVKSLKTESLSVKDGLFDNQVAGKLKVMLNHVQVRDVQTPNETENRSEQKKVALHVDNLHVTNKAKFAEVYVAGEMSSGWVDSTLKLSVPEKAKDNTETNQKDALTDRKTKMVRWLRGATDQ
jgi:hypothetical protein